jgi:hypothetical protein
MLLRNRKHGAISDISHAALCSSDAGSFSFHLSRLTSLSHPAPNGASLPICAATGFDVLVQEFKALGFRPACAWYLNDDANIAYARKAPNGGQLSQPVLFVNRDAYRVQFG